MIYKPGKYVRHTLATFLFVTITLANALNTSSAHSSATKLYQAENDSVPDSERATASDESEHYTTPLLNPSAPNVRRDPPRCCVRWFHWANVSTARPILLNRLQVDRLFEFPIKPSGPILPNTQTGSPHEHPSSKRTLNCYLLYIYSPDCPFSATFFLHISALARAYPQIPVYLVNVRDYVAHRWSLRVLYVPKLKVIVNGRIFREYHDTHYQLDRVVEFVYKAIHELPKGPVNVTSEDIIAVPYIPPDRANPTLVLGAWAVTVASLIYLLIAFGSGLVRFLSKWSYRLSGGRFGRHDDTNMQPDLGALQNWDPGQLIAFAN